nr:hypothetical protein [Tanacetum cinerariifolium]
MTYVYTTQVLEDTHVTLTPVNPDGQQQSLSVSSQFVTSMLNPSPDTGIDSLFESTHRVDVSVSTTVVPLLVTAPTLPPPSIPIMSQVQQAPAPTPTTAPSTSLQDLLNFVSLFGFDHRLKTLEANFSEFMQTNQFAEAASSIPGFVDRYMYHRMNEAVKVALKKILIEKLESNKSIHRSDEQRNLYKTLVDVYECDKIILDTYGHTVTLKRRHDDEDKDEEPSAGSDHGSKRRRAGKEPESTSAPKEKATTDQLDWNNPEGQQYPHNLLKPLPLIPNSRGRRIIPFDHFTNNDLEYLRGGASIRKESARDVYSKRRIIAVTELQIVEWYNYKHLDWINVHRVDDKLYKFKEGDLKRLHIQDIKDMLLLLVQGKLTNLTVEERFAFNVSLRMFTRSIVIQWRVEDLQLGVESYQKKLNLTKPDTYRSDLKRKEAYTAYFNPRGFVYQNKDKQNRLMCIVELHKFSDGTLNDVRTALDDRIKGIRMKYLPQTIWIRSEKEIATSMI